MYDAAGHQLQLSSSPGTTALYDAEGRIAKITWSGGGTVSYDYDAEGHRVRKSLGPSVTYYVYGADGELMAEYSSSGSAAGTQYLVPDQVGSIRLVVEAQGNCLKRLDYAPFGALVGRSGDPCSASSAGDMPLYTGQIRDNETSVIDGVTGLDYFNARYYWAVLGRFTSPDLPRLDQNPADPQSWNLYTYARNNPLKYVDPSGDAVCTYSSGNTPDGGAATTEKSCTEGGGTWVYDSSDITDSNGNAAEVLRFSVTKTESTGELSASGQAVVNQLGKNADPSMALIATVAGGSAALGASAALAPVAGQALNEIAFGSATGRLFWAGGSVAAKAAATSGAARVFSQSPAGGHSSD